MTNSLAKFMKSFFTRYLPVQRGLSINTIASYRDATKLLLCYAAQLLKKSVDALHVQDLSVDLVLKFLDYLQEDRGCSGGTRNLRLAAIRSLFAYIGREQPELLAQCQQIRAIPTQRAQAAKVGYLEEAEMNALIDAADLNTRTGVRDRLLLLLMYNTGARVSEIVNLERGHLRLNQSPQVDLLGKGNKHRSCPLWPDTVAVLKDYLRLREQEKPEIQSLFLNANGVPITRFGIGHIVSKYAEIAAEKCPSIKTKNVTPHIIRHTTAMHLLRSGNEINMVKSWLGHADINTTRIYLDIDMEMKRKMIEKADAPSIKGKAPWHKPGILEWLSTLGKGPELCAVNQQ